MSEKYLSETERFPPTHLRTTKGEGYSAQRHYHEDQQCGAHRGLKG